MRAEPGRSCTGRDLLTVVHAPTAAEEEEAVRDLCRAHHDARSSGDRHRSGPITKTGNTLARRLMVEAAWHYRHPSGRSRTGGPAAERTNRGGQC